MRFELDVSLAEGVDPTDRDALNDLADAILDSLCDSAAPPGVVSYDGLDPDPQPGDLP